MTQSSSGQLQALTILGGIRRTEPGVNDRTSFSNQTGHEPEYKSDHGTRGSFTLPPVIHNSVKKKVPGRYIISTDPAPEERWGMLLYINDCGEKVTEKVPVGCARYEYIYDSLIAAIKGRGEKCVRDEEVTCVLEILEEATKVAKSHQK